MFTIYHLFFYLLFLSSIVLKKKRDQRMWFWFCVWLIVLLTGIRDVSNYSDLTNYLSYYKTGEIEDYLLSYEINPGYSFLNKVFWKLGFSFQYFLFFIGAFILGTYAWFINKYSPNILLSLAIFILINYIMSLAALRQFLACAVGLIAIDAAIRRKLIPYVMSVFVAISMHTSAIVLLPFYYIYGLEINKRKKWFLFGAVVIITVGLNYLASHLSAISAYYANYLNEDNESSLYRTIMKVFICALYIYALRGGAFEKDIRFMVLICLVVNIVLYVGGSQISGMYRLRNYFEISEIIGIPLILQRVKSFIGVKKLFLCVGVITYMALLFISFCSILSSNSVVIDSSVYKTIISTF